MESSEFEFGMAQDWVNLAKEEYRDHGSLPQASWASV